MIEYNVWDAHNQRFVYKNNRFKAKKPKDYAREKRIRICKHYGRTDFFVVFFKLSGPIYSEPWKHWTSNV